MGIRFYCPNGHKLNVKEFQAGRKGICPFCGAKTQIPTRSTRKSFRQERAEKRAAKQGRVVPVARGPQRQSAALAGERVGPVDLAACPEPDRPAEGPVSPAAVTLAAPVGAELTPAPAEPFQSAPGSYQSAAGPQSSPPATLAQGTVSAASPAAAVDLFSVDVNAAATPASPVPAPSAAAPEVTADPLAGAGEVVWYVRPPSGGQFGPAGSDIMRAWLAEGRVSPDSLVWREGWRDWQEAWEVFPQLSGVPLAGSLDALMATDVPPISVNPRMLRAASRRQSRHTQATIVAALLVALIILFAVLLLIWFHEPAVPTETASGQRAAVSPADPIGFHPPPAVQPRSA